MGRLGWQLETQQKVLDLVEALLTWADRKIEEGEESPYAIEFEWVTQSFNGFWLQIQTTDQDLNQLFIRFCEQEKGKKIKSSKRDLNYLVEKLEEIKLSEPSNDGVHNLQRVPGKLFYLKLPSKSRPTNLRYVHSLIATQSLSAQGQLVLGTEAQVRTVRQQLSKRIHQEYGRIRVFGLPEPIDVKNIYTGTDVWKEIVNQRWRSLFALLQSPVAAEHLNRLGLEGQEPSRHSGRDLAENLQRLMVLGKPGVGKTTYLQYLVVQCIEGTFQPDKIPIFVQLSYFAKVVQQDSNENALFDFICSTLKPWGVSKESVQTILEAGKALICLDGLDEVPASSDEFAVTQTRQFINQYGDNSFLITCRVAANRYRFSEENFTEIEVADFNREQAESFIRLWFKALLKDQSQSESDQSEDLIEALNQPQHRAIRELAVTPLLLNLICIVFRDMQALPKTQHQLYERGIDALLEKWDLHRNVCRDEIYLNLRKANKVELLAQLAQLTFEQSQIFFRQQLAQEVVACYLQQFNLATFGSIQLQEDGKAVIEAIAAHHGLLAERAIGIYSFSHLSFHEYFVARSIHTKQAWQTLLSQICNPQWREVFLLVTEMQFSADNLICQMEKQIQTIFATQSELQQLLNWANTKAIKTAEKLPYKVSALRAWYLSLAGCNFDEGVEAFRKSGQAADCDQAILLAQTMGLDETFARDLTDFNVLYQRMRYALTLVSTEKLANDIMSAFARFYHTRLVDAILPALLSIKELLLQLNTLTFPPQQSLFIHWWQQNGGEWAANLLNELQFFDSTNHKNEVLLQFSYLSDEVNRDVLKKYYDANLLLLDCIRRAEFVDPSLRQEVEANLLLPSEIQ